MRSGRSYSHCSQRKNPGRDGHLRITGVASMAWYGLPEQAHRGGIYPNGMGHVGPFLADFTAGASSGSGIASVRRCSSRPTPTAS